MSLLSVHSSGLTFRLSKRDDTGKMYNMKGTYRKCAVLVSMCLILMTREVRSIVCCLNSNTCAKRKLWRDCAGPFEHSLLAYTNSIQIDIKHLAHLSNLYCVYML